MNPLDLIAAVIRSAHFTIVGRIGRDPEPKYFDSGKCKLQLSIACNRANAKKGDETPPDWFKAEFWNEDAQQAADELRKGDLVSVTGRVCTESWTTREGEQRTDLVIKVESWAPVGNPAPTPAAAPPALPMQQGAPAFDEVPF